MKPSLEAMLDWLEPSLTRRQTRWLNKPIPRFWARLDPRLHLDPTEEYPWRACLNIGFAKAAFMLVFVAIWALLPFALLWHDYPGFLRRAPSARGREHTLLVGLLSHLGLYQTPAAMPFLAAFAIALELPFCYFWNRRAVRLRREGLLGLPSQSEEPAPDATVWPPAPRTPTG